jgi:hypothetical protein
MLLELVCFKVWKSYVTLIWGCSILEPRQQILSCIIDPSFKNPNYSNQTSKNLYGDLTISFRLKKRRVRIRYVCTILLLGPLAAVACLQTR